MDTLLSRIYELSLGTAPSVGIGSSREGDAAEVSASKAVAEGLCPVEVLRGPDELVGAITSGQVTTAVRGTLSASGVLPPLLEWANVTSARRVALMEGGSDTSFLLAPVGIDEGRDLEERWQLLQDAARLVSALGMVPRVAVMSKGRDEDAGRGEEIDRSLGECKALEERASDAGLDAHCVGILLERAVASSNVVVAPDGVAGNLIFRSLHYVAGNESWGALALGLMPLVYVDTSRDKDDYLGAIRLARAIGSITDAEGRQP